jgi:hypothetical protein
LNDLDSLLSDFYRCVREFKRDLTRQKILTSIVGAEMFKPVFVLSVAGFLATSCGCFHGNGQGLFRQNSYGTVYAPPAYATAPQYAAAPVVTTTPPVITQPAPQQVVLAAPQVAAPQVIYAQPPQQSVMPTSYYQTGGNACCTPCPCQ